MMTDKRTITAAEYLQLLGLKTLADSHTRWLNEITKSIREIVTDDGSGHVEDFAFIEDDMTLDEFLKRIKVTVEGK